MKGVFVMFKKTKLYVGVSLLVQAVSSVVMFFILLGKKKSIAGAFLAHHKFVKPEVIDKIFRSLKNKDTLVGKLAEMYNEPIAAMVNEPEADEGNVDWTASW